MLKIKFHTLEKENGGESSMRAIFLALVAKGLPLLNPQPTPLFQSSK